ncbi:MAG: DMT family transporter [Oscillospiraceae bacterium]|jgi:drug/metabolite transporter (DMT)-like permease|nr:DMT family transporter [Oscillospiraceae bacterium]
MSTKKVRIISVIAILFAAMIWGSSFVVMKNALDVISPMYLIAVRFTLAGAVGTAAFFPGIRNLRLSDFKSGMKCGCALGAAYILQTYGLKYTSASNNAFLTTIYVVITPFIFWFFRRGRITVRDFVAAGTALVGIAMVSLANGLSSFRIGDLWTILCGAAFAVHIFMVDCNTENRDVIPFAITQMVGAAVVSWLAAIVFEGAPPESIIGSRTIILSLLYLALFGTMFAFAAQTSAQKHLSSLTASLLLSLECVFGAFFSVLLLGDPFTLKIAVGFALIFGAIAISVLRYPHKTADGEESPERG